MIRGVYHIGWIPGHSRVLDIWVSTRGFSFDFNSYIEKRIMSIRGSWSVLWLLSLLSWIFPDCWRMLSLETVCDRDVIKPMCQVISRDLIKPSTHIYLSRRTVAYPMCSWGCWLLDSIPLFLESEYSAISEPARAFWKSCISPRTVDVPQGEVTGHCWMLHGCRGQRIASSLKILIPGADTLGHIRWMDIEDSRPDHTQVIRDVR